MVKAKYNKANIELCLKIVRETGDPVNIWSRPKPVIGRSTYYDWCERYSEFPDKIDRARVHWLENIPTQYKVLARQKYIDILTNGERLEWDNENEQEHLDPKGNLIKTRRVGRRFLRRVPAVRRER